MDGLTGYLNDLWYKYMELSPQEIAEQKKPKIRLPITTEAPALDRAIKILGKHFPQEIQQANIQQMPWRDSLDEPNIEGVTEPNKDIYMNRILLALGSDPDIQQVLAHELTHIGQPPQTLNEAMMPYTQRPREIEAYKNSSRIRNLLMQGVNPKDLGKYLLVEPYRKYNPYEGIPNYFRIMSQ